MKSTTQVAVLGLGAMGTHHCRVFRELGILGGLHDSDGARLTKVSADAVASLRNPDITIRSFDTLAQVLACSEINTVSIALPTPFHADVAIQCLEAGKDVFVEKPLSLDLESGQRIIDAAKKNNKVVAVGYIERFNPSVREIKRLIDVGHLGEITSINIRRVGGLPRSADNIITDLMTHDIDILLHIFGIRPSSSYKVSSRRNNITDSAQVLLKFGDCSATCESNWISPVKIREIHVTGTGGYAKADLIKQEVTQYQSMDLASAHQKIELQSFKGEPLRLELEAFVDAIRTRNVDGIVTGEDALNTLELTQELAAQV